MVWRRYPNESWLGDSLWTKRNEATAALDNNAQEDIIDLIFKLLKGRTVIIIAHRLKAIKKCDNIIVLEDGSVAEKGNHDSLMKKKEFILCFITKKNKKIDRKLT